MAKARLTAREVDGRYQSIFWTDWEINYGKALEVAEEIDLPSGVEHYRVGELFAGIVTAPEVAEGEEYTTYAPQEGKNVYIPTKLYKFAFRATKQLRKFGRSRQIYEYPRKQSQIMAHTILIQIYAWLNRAFNVSYPTAYDQAVLGGSHTLANGETFSNVLGVAADFNENTLESMIELMVQTPNEDGIFTGRQPKTVAVNTAQWATVMQVLGSTTTTLQGSGESGNAINAVAAGYGIRPHFSPYISDTDATHLLGEESPIKVVWASRIELLEVFEDKMTLDWLWRTEGQWTVAPNTWRGYVGTPGV